MHGDARNGDPLGWLTRPGTTTRGGQPWHGATGSTRWVGSWIDDDPRTAEVGSKVELLARDDQVQDPTILAQAARLTRGADPAGRQARVKTTTV